MKPAWLPAASERLVVVERVHIDPMPTIDFGQGFGQRTSRERQVEQPRGGGR